MLLRLQLAQSSIHPLLYATVALATGIWWQASSHNSLILAFSLFAALMVAVSRGNNSISRIKLAALLVISFFIGIGLFWYQHRKHYGLQNRICRTQCSVQGTVIAKEPSGNPFMNSRIDLAIKSIKKHNSTWIHESGTVQIYTRNTKKLLVGDTIELHKLTFKKTTGTSFDNYLIKNGIAATTFVTDLDYTLLHRPWWSIKRLLWQTRNNLYNRLKSKFSQQTSSLFFSTFLGNRTDKKNFFRTTKDRFKAWGILHFLARSGLHLVIFIIMWKLLLGLIPLSFAIKQFILIMIGILYCALSWTSLPFIRALSIFLLYKTSPLANSRSSSVYLLVLVCSVMLISNPIQLLFLDFQLSFGLTFVLAWFSQLQQQKKMLSQNC